MKLVLTEAEIEALRAPFPRAAYKEYKAGGPTLTTLKPGYYWERLHSVFGVGNVTVVDLVTPERRVQALPDGRAILHFQGKLVIRLQPADRGALEIPLSGMDQLVAETKGNAVEDCWKGCITNAVSKAIFHTLGIGTEMFKGLVHFPDGSKVAALREEDTTPLGITTGATAGPSKVAGKPPANDELALKVKQVRGELIAWGRKDPDAMKELMMGYFEARQMPECKFADLADSEILALDAFRKGLK